jgi:hypothetical protein
MGYFADITLARGARRHLRRYGVWANSLVPLPPIPGCQITAEMQGLLQDLL